MRSPSWPPGKTTSPLISSANGASLIVRANLHRSVRTSGGWVVIDWMIVFGGSPSIFPNSIRMSLGVYFNANPRSVTGVFQGYFESQLGGRSSESQIAGNFHIGRHPWAIGSEEGFVR